MPRKREEAAPAAKQPEAVPEPAAEDDGGFPRQADVIEIRVATHVYTGQDEDELTLAPGDIIHVIPTPPDEEEEEVRYFSRVVSCHCVPLHLDLPSTITPDSNPTCFCPGSPPPLMPTSTRPL